MEVRMAFVRSLVIDFPIPAEYDTFLRTMYGDYMALPPEDKRIPHHLKAFYNLKARVEVKMQ